ncbi:serine/threonine-protein phosphatase 6 regulatory ankyrin repeat subunit C-like [Haliotis rubra]|uniref:serine/threonine-protein phosphatase 6 regulatory ankyrin repeat subunit C-like n=1 Tax=Haliotis rubra TaxID=36100 RepID=UPI001EE5F012|nr:serine/threonine-protein phosphatase 6 regulatory ankyrin repeat subunit C-like [Haliotis rubra]
MFDFHLQNGADLSQEDDNRYNILHMAGQGGNMELVKYVLAQNIVKNSRSDAGWTSALETANEGHTEVLKVLVSEGADPTLVNRENNNIIHVALKGKHMDTVKYVFANDFVEIDNRNIEGMTAVMLAVDEGLAEIFDLIVRKGSNLPLVNDDKQNILHMACDE